MKKTIILCGNINDANGICAIELRNELISQGNAVDVVCYENDNISKKDNSFHEIKRNALKEKRKYKFRIISKIDSILSLIKYYFVSPPVYKKNVDEYYTACKTICSQESIDTIVAIYYPFAAILALKKIKKEFPKVKIVLYQLDIACAIQTPSLSYKFLQLTYNKAMRKLYKVYDKIIIMRSHEDVWRKTFARYQHKLLVSDLPMLASAKYHITNRYSNGKSVHIVYSGLLEKRYRDPQYALDILINEQLSKIHPIVKFYSRGDCENLLEEYSRKNKNIIPMGYVSKALLDEELEKADFLLNIGNLDTQSVPSKTIVYLSTGKPIIHFAYNKKDSCLYYLEKYPLGLVVFMDENVEENTKKVANFINGYLGKRVDFDAIKKLFPMNLPKYSCDLILRA